MPRGAFRACTGGAADDVVLRNIAEALTAPARAEKAKKPFIVSELSDIEV